MDDPQFNFQVKKKIILFLSLLLVGILIIAFNTCGHSQ